MDQPAGESFSPSSNPVDSERNEPRAQLDDSSALNPNHNPQEASGSSPDVIPAAAAAAAAVSDSMTPDRPQSSSAVSSPNLASFLPRREDSDEFPEDDDSEQAPRGRLMQYAQYSYYRPRRVSDNSSGEDDSDQQNSVDNRSRWDQHHSHRRGELLQGHSRRALPEEYLGEDLRAEHRSPLRNVSFTDDHSSHAHHHHHNHSQPHHGVASDSPPAASAATVVTTTGMSMRVASPSRLSGSPLHFDKDKDKDADKDKEKLGTKLSTRNVTLVIDGNRFPVNVEKLQAHPDTMLGRMFTTSVQSRARESSEFVIEYEIEPSLFRSILGYYDSGIVKCTNDSNLFELLQACEYFMIPVSTKTIACRNLGKIFHYLSDNGARDIFVKTYLPNYLMPLMEQCALRGERQCFVVTLYSDDELVWDESHPPPFGEDIKKVIHSSELVRFLNFSENREIAKEALLERGLKKVRVGIEGFPIDLIDSPGSSASNAYRYEQRPYLFISWEKEEKSNRHVFFQRVKRTRRRTQSPPPVD